MPRTTRFAAAWLVCAAVACLVAAVVIRAGRSDGGAGRTRLAWPLLSSSTPERAGCTSPTVSAPTVVLDAETRRRLGLNAWPDTQPGVLRGPDGGYVFLSAGASTVNGSPQEQVVTAGSLDTTARAGLVHRAAIIGAPAGYQYVGAGQTYRDPGSSTILAVVHLERALDAKAIRPYYTELGLARIDPNTYQATFLGLFLRPTVTYEDARRAGATVDVGTPSLVARDGYLYAYFSEFSPAVNGQVTATALSVARTSLPDALSAARAGTVSPWVKLWQDDWTSPGLGGPAQDLQRGQAPAWEPSAAYDPELGVTLVVAPVSESRITLSQSSETTSGWGRQLELWSDPGKFDAYPVIVGTGENPALPGTTFYIFYLQWQSAAERDWKTAIQLRRTITCQPSA